MEKSCKWNFKPEGGRDVGPNDPVDEKFKGQPYYSIVRESIQNSLDAVSDDCKPVKVSFKLFEISRLEFPNFFNLEEHINQCNEFYSDNENATELFSNMLGYLNGHEEGKKKLKLSCMRISDSNTRGMSFDSDNTNSPFYAFLRAGGVSAKNQGGSGGSFGFGKGAYYTLSPLKTIVVSTKGDKENVYFEGSTILTTHKDVDGNKLTAYGYYDSNDGEPIEEAENIPEIFRRHEIGTDINIIGLWEENNRKTLMMKSVLNNFWLAIYKEKLIVEIDDEVLNKDNLEQMIDNYFSNDFESGKADDIASWNPRPYFKAVKYGESNNSQFILFKEELEVIGSCKLYIYLERKLPNRVSFFRRPQMVVFKRTNRKINGYVGVFMCENETGNEYLRRMENPSHNEWKKENYPKSEGRIDKDARKIENVIRQFVNDCLESLAGINTNKKISFLGLEDYLSIPEDLLEQEDDFDFEGDSLNDFSGEISNDFGDDETPVQSTTKDAVRKIKPTITEPSDVKTDTDAILEEEGEFEFSSGGGENDSGGGDEHGEDDGGDKEKGNMTDDEESSNKLLLSVGLNVAAQKENDKMYHVLIIDSPNNVDKAEIELFVGADNDRDDNVKIISTDNGIVKNNVLNDVSLIFGVNKVKIQFENNLKHSIKLKAYEIQ